MTGYLLRRLGLMLLTLFGISIIIFVLLRLEPWIASASPRNDDVRAARFWVFNPAESKKLIRGFAAGRTQGLQWIKSFLLLFFKKEVLAATCLPF